MQTYKQHILTLLALLPAAFTACNKEDLSAGRAMQVLIAGYNSSGHALQVSLDTTVYDASVKAGNFIVKPESLVHFNATHFYATNRQHKMVVITDTVTKQEVFRQPLPASGTKAYFSFLYIDGKEVPSQPPAADPQANTLGFYLRYTGSNDPVDISLTRADATTGQVHRAYLARNVQPNTWAYADYLAHPQFANRQMLEGASICFTKAGTTDQWAFFDDESNSKMSVTSLLLPQAGEKGIVQPYFVVHGVWGLEIGRMFFYPDRG
ncbi:hypothetical protein ACFOTA_14965 [Chitinophaga sp. GCM10012297]|uniref:DUF4397 domain-containing protein n=1 Tax=Chitinophaga chungangae TaxID=2821488 RepID=A0ABS3YGD9_9BACT|nr:hypothetical protein [Chitinophaga chungangae]MBO9153520.1 hypothetical protein [Chitinophaga chungangae]